MTTETAAFNGADRKLVDTANDRAAHMPDFITPEGQENNCTDVLAELVLRELDRARASTAGRDTEGWTRTSDILGALSREALEMLLEWAIFDLRSHETYNYEFGLPPCTIRPGTNGAALEEKHGGCPLARGDGGDAVAPPVPEGDIPF
jgi:hypothetical protein